MDLQNPSTISSASENSGWFEIGATIDPVALLISGTWVGTLAVDISNDPRTTAAKTYLTLGTSYTANNWLEVPRRIAFIRVRPTAWTSGTAQVSVSPGKGIDGKPYPIVVQSVTYP